MGGFKQQRRNITRRMNMKNKKVFRAVKVVLFLVLFAWELSVCLNTGFTSMRIIAMVACLMVAVLAFFGIGERK